MEKKTVNITIKRLPQWAFNVLIVIFSLFLTFLITNYEREHYEKILDTELDEICPNYGARSAVIKRFIDLEHLQAKKVKINLIKEENKLFDKVIFNEKLKINDKVYIDENESVKYELSKIGFGYLFTYNPMLLYGEEINCPAYILSTVQRENKLLFINDFAVEFKIIVFKNNKYINNKIATQLYDEYISNNFPVYDDLSMFDSNKGNKFYKYNRLEVKPAYSSTYTLPEIREFDNFYLISYDAPQDNNWYSIRSKKSYFEFILDKKTFAIQWSIYSVSLLFLIFGGTFLINYFRKNKIKINIKE